MKRVIRGAVLAVVLWVVWIAASIATAQPAITRPVTDETGVLSSAAIEAIEARLLAHREAGHAQIALLLVHSTNGEPITDYANRAATAWGGGTASADDGVLFVLALDDHEMRIEVGYGLEASLTDAIAMRILDDLVTPLRDGRFDAAAWAVSDALIARTGGESLPTPESLAQVRSPATPERPHREPPSGELPRAPAFVVDGDEVWATLKVLALFVVPGLLFFAYFYRESNTTYDADGVARTDWGRVVRVVSIVVVAIVVLAVTAVVAGGIGVVALLFAAFVVAFVALMVRIARLDHGSGSGGWGSGGGSGSSNDSGRRSRRSSFGGKRSFGGGSGSGGRSFGGGGGRFGGGGASKRW